MVKATESTKPVSAKSIQRKWHVIDVNGKVLGRVANEIAELLIGKSKVNYVPYLDMGDNVVVINSAKVTVTGRKMDEKIYQNFSGYPGGLKEMPLKTVMERNPERALRTAVSGMLPKNKLRDRRLARLHIFPDENHPFQGNIS